MSINNSVVYGKENVTELLLSETPIDRVYLSGAAQNPSYKKIIALCKNRGVPIVHTDSAYINKKAPNLNHQGVIAITAEKEYCTVSDILKTAEKKREKPFIIIADEIVDPHNLGAIIRSADAFGVHGIVISKRHAVGLTSSVSKASGGALHFIPVARVANLAAAIDELKKHNVWIYGCDMAGEKVYYHQDYSGGAALIVGSEEIGISNILKEKCDFMVRIPMKGKISCLNASVAAAVIMQEISRQRSEENNE